MPRIRQVTLGVLLLLIVTAGTAIAASPGSAFRLGVLNTVGQLTRLSAGLAGAVLSITNTGAGPALQLTVKPGAAPLTVNSSVKVSHLNADLLDGRHASYFLPANGTAQDSRRLDGKPASNYLTVQDARSFIGARTTKRESPESVGQTLGDGTHKLGMSCSPGEVLLSGGPANIRAGTLVLESYPSGPIANPNSWTVRIQSGTPDPFSVVIICAPGGP